MAKTYGAAQQTGSPAGGKGRAVLCGLIIAAGVGTGICGLVKSMDFNGKMAEYEAAIAALEADIAREADNKVTPESAQELLSNARAQGEAVAELQNQYGELDILTQEQEYSNVAVELEQYFLDKTAQSQWYRPLDDTGYTWQFNTTYDFSGSTLNVLFTCWDDNDRLVAYTTGMYMNELKQFRDLGRHFTGEGYKHMDYVQPETVPTDTPDNSAEQVSESGATESGSEGQEGVSNGI